MKASPLLLDKSFLGEVALKPSEKEVIKVDEVKVDTEIHFGQHATDPLRWFVKIKVVFGAAEGKAAPYEGHIELSGLFQIAKTTNLSEEKQRQIIAINCPSMLYASARELIALLTSRGKYGVFFLPSVSFSDQRLVERKEVPDLPEATEAREEEPAKS